MNHEVVAGLCDLHGALFSMLFTLLMPREEWGLVNTQTDPDEANFGFIFGWLVGLWAATWLMGRVVGGLIAAAFTRGAFAPAAWFGDRWWSMFEQLFWHIAFMYWHMDGDTDGGRYDPTGAGEYAGYPDFETSPYTLPYPAGRSCYVGQANQGLFSHNKLNGNQVYAYDFSLDSDDIIVASRPGTVVNWVDWVPNDVNEETAFTDSDYTHTQNANQESSDNKNLVLIRHDIDEDADPASPYYAMGSFHPHDVGLDGVAVRTYGAYLHGRTGSVVELFGARGIAPEDIIGTRVRRGDPIMRCGNTGKSFHNHLHMAIRPGPDSPGADTPGAGAAANPGVAYGSMGDEIPYVFKDVTNFIGTDGVPKKLEWYTSSTSAPG
jgi:hypothetical protein